MDKKGDIPRTLGLQERLLREVHKPCFAKDLMRRLCEKRNGFLALENRIFRPQPFTAGSKSTNAFNLKRNARERAQGTARCGILQSCNLNPQKPSSRSPTANRLHAQSTCIKQSGRAGRKLIGLSQASGKPPGAQSSRDREGGKALGTLELSEVAQRLGAKGLRKVDRFAAAPTSSKTRRSPLRKIPRPQPPPTKTPRAWDRARGLKRGASFRLSAGKSSCKPAAQSP